MNTGKLTVGELVYKISGDMDNLKTELAKSQAEIEKLGASISKTDKSTGNFSAGLDRAKIAMLGIAAVAAVQVKNAFVGSIEQASKLTESINAVNVVFGSGAQKILDYGKNAATSVGLARSEYNQLATVTGALLKDTGLSMDEVATITNDLTVRAADMASVFNTSVPDALSAVNQALRGETEAIRRYAGDVTDASLQTFLYSQGIRKNVTELTEQEKRLYRVQLIMKQTDVTTGDFANTSNSLANQQRILSSRFKDLQARLGTQLLPAITNVIGAFVNTQKESKDTSTSADSLGRTFYRLSNVLIVLGSTASTVASGIRLAWNVTQNAFLGSAGAILKASQLVAKGLGQDTTTIDGAIADLSSQIAKNTSDITDSFSGLGVNSARVQKALAQTFNPTEYKPIQETAGAIKEVAVATGGVGKASKETKKDVEDLRGKLLELRQGAIDTRKELEDNLAKAVEAFGKDAKANVQETVTSLAQLVVESEKKIKDLKAQVLVETDPEARKKLEEEIAAQNKISESRVGFEERQAARILDIRKRLTEGGINPDQAGLKSLTDLKTLEQQIIEERRVQSLSEFARYEEEQAKKLEIIVASLLTENTLIKAKIDTQIKYEADLTTFLQSEEAKRSASTEIWAQKTIQKYKEVADSLRQFISLQNQVNGLSSVSSINPGSSVSTTPETNSNSGGVVNNKNVTAPVTINATTNSNVDFRAVGRDMSFEVNRL